MKNLSKYIIFSITIGLFCSCNDELDLKPISQETADNAYSSGPQINAALTGVYESFQSSDYYVWDHILFQDVRSDNAYAGGDNPDIFQIDKVDIPRTNPRVFTLWSTVYNAISKANLVLEKAPLVNENITEKEREQIIGQAYFLRAYNYYTLVKNFGGVPLYLDFVNSPDPSVMQLPRSSEEEVYNQIINDLNEANSRVPDIYEEGINGINKARATKGAVNALLAKVYAQKPSQDYALVVEYANAVINSPAGYALLNNYDDLFNGNNENNAESILEIQYLGSTEGNWAPQMQLPPSISGDAWRKFVTPSVDLVEAFDSEGDEIRKNASILFESVSWLDEYWGNSANTSIPFAYKWRSAGAWASANNEYIFRLADVMLLKAEALNELGQSAQAEEIVNTIRERVELAPLTEEQTASQSAMRDAILKERRLELAFESVRWDDLVRYKKAIEIMNSVDDENLATGQEVNYNVSENDLLLPIPQSEINRNPNLEQNPGY